MLEVCRAAHTTSIVHARALVSDGAEYRIDSADWGGGGAVVKADPAHMPGGEMVSIRAVVCQSDSSK